MHEWLLQSSLEPSLGGQAQMRYRHATVVEVLNKLAEIHGFHSIEEPKDACFDGSSSPDTDTDTDTDTTTDRYTNANTAKKPEPRPVSSGGLSAVSNGR